MVWKVMIPFIWWNPWDNQPSLIISENIMLYFLSFISWPVSPCDWFNTLSISSILFNISEEFTIWPYSNRTTSNSFYERTVMLPPTNILIELRHFLHLMTSISYFPSTLFCSISSSFLDFFSSFKNKKIFILQISSFFLCVFLWFKYYQIFVFIWSLHYTWWELISRTTWQLNIVSLD